MNQLFLRQFLDFYKLIESHFFHVILENLSFWTHVIVSLEDINFRLHLNQRMIVIWSISLINLIETLSESKVAMLLVSMFIIDQTEKERVVILTNVVHLKSDLFFVVGLFDSNVLVHSIRGLNDHEFIFIIVFNFMI